MKIKLIITLVLLLILNTVTQAQVATPIPLPKDVKYGKLSNGMNYYVLKNQQSKGKASFFFVQNVGGIIEEDNEDGLAHFLEHMAFNGSTNFPGSGGIDKFLQSKGFILGDQYNAVTDWDKTIYYVDRVPVEDTEFVDNIMLMMHDWSGYILLNNKDIDDERGVIEAEWTGIKNPFTDLDNKTLKTLYNDSRYSHRDVIGDVDFINTFNYKLLKDFYKKWYRPDLQSVIIVGDIDVEAMEEKIKATFSEIPLAKNLPKRPYFEIPEIKSSQYVLATSKDEQIKNTSLSMGFWNKAAKIKDETYLRDNLVRNLFRSLISKRFQQILETNNAPFKSARATTSSVTLFDNLTALSVSPKEGQNLEAFKVAYREINRVSRFGFLQSELDLAKRNTVTSYTSATDRELNKTNANYANQLINYVISAIPMTSAQSNLDFVTKTLPTITLEDLNKEIKKFDDLEKSIFVVKGPDKKSIDYPTHKTLLEVIAGEKREELKQIEEENFDTIINKPLISKTLPVKNIKETFAIKGIKEAKGYVLDNGVKVVLIPSKKKGSAISMRATSPGGTAALKVEEFPVIDVAINLLNSSGLGDFSKEDLSKKLDGKRVFVRPGYRTNYDLVSGNALESDFELLLQMTYLTFESPRFDENKYEAKKAQWKDDYDTYYVSAYKSKFYNVLNEITLGNAPRDQPAKIEDFDYVTFERAKALFKKRFSDADDFNFVFTGNFENDKVLPLIQKYIGNLTSKTTSETFTKHKTTHVKGFTIKDIETTEPLDATSVYYSLENKNIDYTYKNDLITQLIQSVLETRYFTSVREEEGGTYGVVTNVALTDIPSPLLSLTIEFDCNAEKTTRLLNIIKTEIKQLSTSGPTEEELKNAKTFVLDGRKESITKDYFWEDELLNTNLFGKEHLSLKDYTSMMNNITKKQIQDFATAYFTTANGLQATYFNKK